MGKEQGEGVGMAIASWTSVVRNDLWGCGSGIFSKAQSLDSGFDDNVRLKCSFKMFDLK